MGRGRELDKRPSLASLFSVGGMDKGFEDAGFRIAYANDFDKDAQEVYRMNLGEIDGRDIRDVPAEEIPDCDVIAAGFPCQPFSTAGLRKGTDDPRGMLYKECLRIIGRKMPKAVVFENVRGLLSAKGPGGNSLAEAIAGDLGHMGGVGYDVQYKLLNASDYGVPQNRMRVIFVGIREGPRRQVRISGAKPEARPHAAPCARHTRTSLEPSGLAAIPAGPRDGGAHSGGRVMEGRAIRPAAGQAEKDTGRHAQIPFAELLPQLLAGRDLRNDNGVGAAGELRDHTPDRGQEAQYPRNRQDPVVPR